MQTTKNKVYQIITDRILGLMSQGEIPWHKPWNGKALMPKNLVTKKNYRGANPFILAMSGFSSPYWLSFKQCAELGGSVRKGEQGMPVVFWKWLDAKPDESGAVELDATGKPRKIPLLRYYTVFNSAQCDGIAEKVPNVSAKISEPEAIETADRIIESMPKRPEIKHGKTGAYYSPVHDYVGMPDKEAFKDSPHYYCTLFHELGHSTGHESRLARKGVVNSDGKWNSYGSAPYAKEELVAEMTAAFLCGESGILHVTQNDSAGYLQSWIKRLKEDPTLFVHAAAQAQKASDFILGIEQQTN